ncbi:hypothetical protein [Paenibacillus odorifer]|uniref:hypothetical protein n=1 Tax=Paenibacillus odorifer TaxID=189426 RepID=UPI0020BDE8D6|nr:hypothetical protein [Paenibacillus odorifer]
MEIRATESEQLLKRTPPAKFAPKRASHCLKLAVWGSTYLHCAELATYSSTYLYRVWNYLPIAQPIYTVRN